MTHGFGLNRPEYLIKQYLHTSGQEPVYLEMWEEALAGIKKHLIIPTKHAKLNFVAELPQGISSWLSPKMDHLVCFLPGAVALGTTYGLSESEAQKLPSWNAKKSQDMKLARELMKTCWGMYRVTETGIAPEIAWFNADEESLRPHSSALPLSRSKDSMTEWKKDYIVKPLDAHNLQRPETVESLFLMWRTTGDQTYREWGWEMFQAFQRYGLLDNGEGYTSLQNVNELPPRRRDNMESFWLVSHAVQSNSIHIGALPSLLLTDDRPKHSSISTSYFLQTITCLSPMSCSTPKRTFCPRSQPKGSGRGGSGYLEDLYCKGWRNVYSYADG